MEFINLFIMFIIYSFFGYILEVIYVFICTKKLTNRGYLYSPLCPIYGVGALIIVLLLYRFYDNYFLVLILGIVLTSTLEYLTSYFMEIIFKRRWWDYSDKFLNLNGRICLRNSTLFGILVMIVIYLIHPYILKFIDLLASPINIIVFSILALGFIVDFILSTIKHVKITVILRKCEKIINDVKHEMQEFKKYVTDTKIYSKLKNLNKNNPTLKLKPMFSKNLLKVNEYINKVFKHEDK